LASAFERGQSQPRAVLAAGPRVGVEPAIIVLLPALRLCRRTRLVQIRNEFSARLRPLLELPLERGGLGQESQFRFDLFDVATLDREDVAERLAALEAHRR